MRHPCPFRNWNNKLYAFGLNFGGGTAKSKNRLVKAVFLLRPVCMTTCNLILGYNRCVNFKTVFLLFAAMVVCTGCNVNIATESPLPVLPEFVTATLPPSPIPPATQTLPTLTAIPSITPIEGTTTTQINVRAQTSTASETLGMIEPFSKVQIIGIDSSGSWYQIIYKEVSNGWVRAEYVQVDASAKVPVLGSVAGNGLGVSGLVIQKINVRKGPATSFDTLGVLNPKDVVFITGKDPSGAWIQIEFASAPDGFGWVALEFLQVANIDSLAIIGNANQATEIPSSSTAASDVNILSAIQDGDSMQAPMTAGILSPADSRILQMIGDVSAPDGDMEDWIQFTSSSAAVTIRLTCSSKTLHVELWNSLTRENDASLSCGEKNLIMTEPNKTYFLRLFEAATDHQYTHYNLSLEALQ